MIHIQYSDGHQACFNYIKRKEPFWNVTLAISKEKYVVLNCPGYTVCWSDSSCCTETSAAAVSFERMRIRKHLRSHIRRKTGKHKDVIRITNHSWQMVDVHRWWLERKNERFCMKTVPTPRAEPGTSIKYCLLNVWAELFIVLNDASYLCY